MSIGMRRFREPALWVGLVVLFAMVDYACVAEASPFYPFSDAGGWRSLIPHVGPAVLRGVAATVAPVFLFPLRNIVLWREAPGLLTSVLHVAFDRRSAIGVHVTFALMNSVIWVLALLGLRWIWSCVGRGKARK